MTVRGQIQPQDLGTTLAHEHILIDSRCLLVRPTDVSKKILVDAPVTIANLSTLKPNYAISKSNLVLDSMSDALDEIGRYKRRGGKSIVDVTMSGLGRNPSALSEISEATEVNIICGTGWYVVQSHPSIVEKLNAKELSRVMVGELTNGIGDSGVKAGVIGEIGCSEPLHPNEEKVLRAAGLAQRQTGAALTFHPPLGVPRPLKGGNCLDILEEEGVDLTKVYMSHADGVYGIDGKRWLEYLRSLLERDIMIAYDCFGCDIYMESLYPGILPMSDRDRIKEVVELCRTGYEKQILLSHDVCTKTQLTKYGGHGYAHILEHIVSPLKMEGVTTRQIREMLIGNPRRLLAF